MADVPQRIGLISDGLGNWALAHKDEAGAAIHFILATPEAIAAAPEVQALIRAAKAEGMREAAGMCESIRISIASGPMPEGARFDYEQTILAAAEKLERP